MSTPPILVCKQLKKAYGDFWAVKDVSFTVAEGEVFSLLGPNGAGKTTLISMLSCLLKPTAGDAEIGSYSIIENPMSVRSLIGVVPQDLALYESLSAWQNLRFWGQMYGMSGSQLKQRCDEVLEQVGLVDRANDRVDTYSGGMKRRLNIAVGLLGKPRLVFMDEPTVGIDPQSRRGILDMIKSLQLAGMAVIYTTHYMEEAEELSDRVGIIDHGKLIAIGTQKELTTQIGSHETLQLHFAEEEVVNDGLVAKLKQAKGIINVVPDSEDANSVAIQVTDAGEVIPEVIKIVNQVDLRLRSLDITEPNLEAVFLHLTGRALRN